VRYGDTQALQSQYCTVPVLCPLVSFTGFYMSSHENRAAGQRDGKRSMYSSFNAVPAIGRACRRGVGLGA